MSIPEEPVPPDAGFRDTPNVLFSAHLAGGLEASYQRIRDMMLDDIGQILKGLPPLVDAARRTDGSPP